MIKAIILTGYGINCEEETAYAFELAGACSDIVHVNDLIDGCKKLDDYQILVFPGGFSYGDDTGSGNALANQIKNHLWEAIRSFIEKDRLVLGICNGFQVMVNLGLLPALEKNYGSREVALVHNDSAQYIDRWVDLAVKSDSPWLLGVNTISLPIAHGEGKFYVPAPTLKSLQRKKLIALEYTKGQICRFQNMKANPNGSLKNIAGITDESGRLFGLMPHPERAIFFHQLPHWPYLKLAHKEKGERIPKSGPGMHIFKNAINYFK